MNIKQTIVKHGGKVTRFFCKTGLKIQKHSPEILVVAGTVSVVTGLVLACKASLKAEEVLDKHEEEMAVIKEAAETKHTEYTEVNRRKDTAIAYAHTFGRFAKLYAPGVGFTLLGIGCYLSAYGIMKRRNLALMAAYKTLETAFADYRKRVIDDVGEEKDQYYRYGSEAATLTEGSSKDCSGGSSYNGYVLPNGRVASMYARLFSERGSTQWCPSDSTNHMNVHLWQNWCNDLLNARGYLFLNEVYQMLGFEPVKEGQVVGWVKNNPRGGDNYVDFHATDVWISDYGDRAILIDPNVDGVVWDLI